MGRVGPGCNAILKELTTASFVAVNDQFEDSTQSLVTQKECPLRN
jgi:hypothetical protein